MGDDGETTADEACCACGGGHIANTNALCEDKCADTEPVNYFEDGKKKRCYCDIYCETDGACCPGRDMTCPVQEPISARDCVDRKTQDGEAWHDSKDEGHTCDAYATFGWCASKSIAEGLVIADSFEWEKMTARKACCACMGGELRTTSSTKTTATVTTETTTTETTATVTSATSVTTTTETSTSATVSTTTATRTSATTSTFTTTTQTTIEGIEHDCRIGRGPFCEVCDQTNGNCLQCNNGRFLLGGSCVRAEACTDRGLITVDYVGRNELEGGPVGRACVADGGLCKAPGCLPTTRMCLASRIVRDVASPHGYTMDECVTCDETVTFNEGGKCQYRANCKGSAFQKKGVIMEGLGKCGCRFVASGDNIENYDIEKKCHRCYQYRDHREGTFPSIAGGASKGNFLKCYGCGGSKFLHEGRCIDEKLCPADTTPYTESRYRSYCQVPFQCAYERRITGDRIAEACKCQSPCVKCSWLPNGIGHKCMICGKGQYLLDGTCVSGNECIEGGGFPLGGGDDGRICSF